jgi:hypothetical protein
MLCVAVAFPCPASSQDEKPAPTTKQNDGEKATGSKSQESGADSVMSLDRMLSLALRHNPDVRAHRARVIAAEAELDRTRLQVVQKVIVYRKNLLGHHELVSVAARSLELHEKDLKAAKRADVPDGQIQERARHVSNDQRNLDFQRARLSEIEIEMPFLLGRKEAERAAADELDAARIQGRLIHMIEELVKVTAKEYQSGNAKLTDVQPWSRRLAELKVRISTTKAERIATVQSHVELLKSIVKVTDGLYRAAQVSRRDALAAQIHLAEAELWLAEVSDGIK